MAERDAAMLMAETIPGGKRVTLAGDKNYDTQELVRELPIPGNLAAFSASNAPGRAYSVYERQPASAASTSKQETCSSRTSLNSPTPTLLRKISISTDGIFCAV